MSVSAPIRIHPEAPDPDPWIDQLQDEHAAALVALSTIETQIYNGERGLWIQLRFEKAERRVKSLTAQLAEELARVGVSRG